MRKVLKIALICLSAVLLSSCGVQKFKDIKVTSFDVDSFSPSGLKAFDAVVALGVDNPAMAFDVKHLKATVKKDTTDIMYLSAENLAVDAKCEKVYKVPVEGTLNRQFTLLQLAVMAKNFDPDEYTVDITADASAKGIGKKLEYKDMPLSKFMDK